MSMFTLPSDRACFLDGGGKLRQHKVIAFCGFIVHPYAMGDFESMWNALLVAGKFTSGLHMAEAMSWQGDYWTQKRAEWGGGENAERERHQLLKTFAAILRASPLKAFGEVADSQYISEKGEKSTRPDLVMFEKAMETAVASMAPDGRLTVFCDWEDGFDALCCKLLAKLRIERPEIGRRISMLAFGDDTAYAQLQAADMFAYLACKDALRMRDTPDAPRDEMFALLTDPIVTTMTTHEMTEMFDAETFRRMVEAHRK